MRRRRFDKRILVLCLGIFVATFSFSFLFNGEKNNNVEAADLSKFNPGNIMSDYVMSDYNSMTEAEIQSFLTSKNTCENRDYSYYEYLSGRNPGIKWHWKDGHFVCLSEELFGDGMVIGEGKTAAKIIYETAQEFKINPKVLIVLIQKESGLITDPIPNDFDYRAMTGFGCPDTAPCDSKYYGFKNQIRKAAELFREVLDGGWTNYPLGENYIQYNPNRDCGGSIVNIENLATSALYRYTPYQPNAGALAAGQGTAPCGAYGNRNFYAYYSDWFGDPTIKIFYEAFIRPRDMKIRKNSRRFNPFTLEEYDIIREDTILKFVEKILIDDKWYYRTENCSLYGIDAVVSAEDVEEIAYELMEPRFVQIAKNTKRINPFNDKKYDEIVDGVVFRVNEKILKSDGWYYRTINCSAYNIDAVLKEEDLLFLEIIPFDNPRYMRTKSESVEFLLNKEQAEVLDEGVVKKYAKKVLMMDGWYYLNEDHMNDEMARIIRSDTVEDLNCAYESFINPRYLMLSEDTKKYNPFNLVGGASVSNGVIEKYISKVYCNGEWYYRSEKDTEKGADAAIRSGSLKEVIYEPFQRPRSLITKNDAVRINVLTGEKFDTILAGTILRYVSKITIGENVYYRTEYMTSNNLDIVLSSNDVDEV